MTDIKEKATEIADCECCGAPHIVRWNDRYVSALQLENEATKQERDNLATALKATAAACADHVNTILQLRSELAGYKQEVSDIVLAALKESK